MLRKPTKNFRISKTTKRLAASIIDAHERGAFIRAMIDGQLVERESPRRERPAQGGGNGGLANLPAVTK